MSGPRVIAGRAKGRRLYMVQGGEARPIGDRPKQALFNILGTGIEESHFLDLFAGTGSVGIEALSRGADVAVFVDLDPNAIRTVHANLEVTGLKEGAVVLRRDAFLYLEAENKRTFDYVYIAPPQYHGLWEKTLLAVDAHIRCLNPDAWVIVQIHPSEFKPILLMNLVEFDQRRYGNTLLVFYEFPGE